VVAPAEIAARTAVADRLTDYIAGMRSPELRFHHRTEAFSRKERDRPFRPGHTVQISSNGIFPARKMRIFAIREVEVGLYGNISASGHTTKAFVCDKAREGCLVFSGALERLHWPFEEPAAFTEIGGGAAPRLQETEGQDPCSRHGVPWRRGLW
jgi:hypothetical protein